MHSVSSCHSHVLAEIKFKALCLLWAELHILQILYVEALTSSTSECDHI